MPLFSSRWREVAVVKRTGLDSGLKFRDCHLVSVDAICGLQKLRINPQPQPHRSVSSMGHRFPDGGRGRIATLCALQ